MPHFNIFISTIYRISLIVNKNITKFLLTIISISLCSSLLVGYTQHSAMTYKPSGGRLGDNLLTFCKSRWLAYKTNLNFFYYKFPGSHNLMLSKHEKLFTQDMQQKYIHIRPIKNNKDISKLSTSTLYISDIYSGYETWQPANKNSNRKDWRIYLHYTDLIKSFKEDVQFLKILRNNLQPTQKPNIPQEILKCPTIAVHIRQGSDKDGPLYSLQLYPQKVKNFYDNKNYDNFFLIKGFSDLQWPQKFPPLQYYINQILYINKLIKNKDVYVYIFTDSKNPAQLTKQISHAVNKKNMIFKYRTEKATVFDDLFAMAYSTYLIRPHSHLSLIAEIIGNHKIAISPKKWHWSENILYITDTNISIRRTYIKELEEKDEYLERLRKQF